MGKTPEERGYKFDWQRKVAECRLGAATKSVAAYLCYHANSDGTNARPGLRLLVHETELSERTVRRCLEQLRDLGLLVRTLRGSTAAKRKYADVYRLTIPDDLESRVKIEKEPSERRSGQGRGGMANHVRWHEKRANIDPSCVHCTEEAEIRPPAKRNPTTGQTDPDHRSVEQYHQSFTTKDSQHHSAPSGAGSRTSSRAPDERFDDFFAAKWKEMVLPGEVLTKDDEEEVRDIIARAYVEHVLGDLDAVEDSTVLGMLYSAHPCTIINKIRCDRGEAA